MKRWHSPYWYLIVCSGLQRWSISETEKPPSVDRWNNSVQFWIPHNRASSSHPLCLLCRPAPSTRRYRLRRGGKIGTSVLLPLLFLLSLLFIFHPSSSSSSFSPLINKCGAKRDAGNGDTKKEGSCPKLIFSRLNADMMNFNMAEQSD